MTAIAAVGATQLAGCNATAGIKPSQATCTQYLTSMQAHQYGNAYKLLTSSCKATATQQQMQNYWELVEKNRGPVKSWSQQGVRFFSGTGGSSVTLGYGLQCANGSSAVTFTCVQENQQWLIQSFMFKG